MSAVFEPPFCANYECGNRVPLERWLWGVPTPHTCSRRCASIVAMKAQQEPARLLHRCRREGCGNRVKDPRNEFCSTTCSARNSMGNVIGEALRITPGDRWEKQAPRMAYTEAVRNQMIRELFCSETSRRVARR